MGWTYTHRPQGQTIKAFFEHEFRGDPKAGSGVLDCAVVDRKTAYIAYRTEVGEVIGIVCLLDYRPEDYYNFGYRDIAEDMGPVEARCPKRILDLLTPTESEYALRWRERCRENLERRVALKDGDWIEFEDANYGGYKRFRVVKQGRATRFSLTDSGYGAYKLLGWQRRRYRVLTPEEVTA